MHLRRYFALLVVSAALLEAPPALADAPPADAAPPSEEGVEREFAREKFREGVKAYDERRYKDAIDLFHQAHSAAPSPAFVFNIAHAYEAMGDSTSALSWFRSYLRETTDTPDRADIEARAQALEAKLASQGIQQMTVLSRPEGATVTIDGRPVGVTPWTGELYPGKHAILLTLRGYDDANTQVDLDPAKARDVALDLVPTREAAPSPPPVVTKEQARPANAERPARVGAVTWMTLGAGTAALGGAIVFESMRASAEGEARAATQVDYPDAVRTMESRRDVALVLAVTGGVLAAAGATLLVIDLNRKQEGPRTAIKLACTPWQCGIAGGGVF
jgi:hypothetical protein